MKTRDYNMAIKFKCSCGREMNVKDALAGRKGKCPGCGQVVTVPMPTGRAAAAPEAPPAATPEQRMSAFTENQPAVQPEVEGEIKTCMHCRKKIPADAVFCTHCGTHLRSGKKEAADHSGVEGDYDFFRTVLAMVWKPAETVGTIVEATPTTRNFQKAILCFAVGTAVFTYMIPHMDPVIRDAAPWWLYLLTAVLAVVVALTSGVVTAVAGTMFGQRGVAFANTFLAVLAVRAIIGAAMLLPILLLPVNIDFLLLWVPRLIRIFGGGVLMYVVIWRAHDCGHGQAALFATVSAAVEGIVFWLGGWLFGWLLLNTTTLVLI